MPPAPRTFASFPSRPDWEALADLGEARSRRRRRRWTGGVLAACLLGAGAGAVVVDGVRSAKPSALASGASASAPSNSPTVAGRPNLLADHCGRADVALGPAAQVSSVTDGYVLRLRNDSDSFAQSAHPVVDVTRSFSVSAWVYNEAPGGSRSAISEGDGSSFSFDLGRDDTGGQKAWVFRVRTAGGGSDGTTAQALVPSAATVGRWTLLTATYDAARHTIALYVNGAPGSSTDVPGVWAGPGALQFGRGRQQGAWGGYWSGVLGHVQVWNQALTPDQVAAVRKSGGAGLAARPTASWLV